MKKCERCQLPEVEHARAEECIGALQGHLVKAVQTAALGQKTTDMWHRAYQAIEKKFNEALSIWNPAKKVCSKVAARIKLWAPKTDEEKKAHGEILDALAKYTEAKEHPTAGKPATEEPPRPKGTALRLVEPVKESAEEKPAAP